MTTLSTHVRRASVAIALTLGVLATFGGPIALASAGVCRTDPVISLSNGKTLTMYEIVHTTPANIAGVTYTVHVPTGITATAITYPGAVPAAQQTVTVQSDNRKHRYDVYSTVLTLTPKIKVKAFTTVDHKRSKTKVSFSGRTMHTHLNAK